MPDDVNILGPESSGQFRLIACRSLSHERRTDCYFHAGRALKDYLQELNWKTEGLHARVTIDGVLVPEADWLTTEPKPGQSVIVRRVFQGGGNGQGGGKQAVQIAAMLALTVAAVYVAGGGLATSSGWLLAQSTSANVLAAGILVAGSLAMNACIPTPRPRRALPQALTEAA